ncbi:hypothetical protein [Okeania sp. SIO1I7]|uniref:hypothetical protein n=1 Tax=Okeania sp. SIO1I7 TaxID=2607772 RepID=UPI0013F7727B|nr:hypothetical protein [Okeania sp. SIO1I7]NET24029.1 hypothetical protein [Okeania sp. SIO1I7]
MSNPLISKLRISRFLSILHKNLINRSWIFWFGLSLAIVLIYGFESLKVSLQSEYFIQDDARQHIFWMRRFLDSELFPQDFIADYFQSVAPWGYKTFYLLITSLGIDPIFLGKLLPIFLGLISTIYCFGISLQILPIPAVGFFSSLILNQTLWMEDDLVSATPRAFFYPLFLAFLYYLLRNSFFPVLIAIALQAIFYPHTVLLSVTILTIRLFSYDKKRLKLTSILLNYWLWLGAIITAAIILLPYKFSATEFGSIITAAEAKLQPIFNYVDGNYGRAFFFHENPLIFWLVGPRSGILFLGFLPPLAIASLFLPFVLGKSQKFPLAKQVSLKVEILVQILLASIGLFFLAHTFLFQLHFPNRYVYHSMRVMIPIAAGIALTIWLDSYLNQVISQLKNGLTFPQRIYLGGTVLLLAILSIIPFSQDLTIDNQFYIKGKEIELYQYLLAQPKDTLIASISKESDNLPTFAQRSTLVAQEYSLPYHTEYYAQFSQRAKDLIQAQYTSNPEEVNNFIQKYGIDFWLLDLTAYNPRYVADKELIRQYDLAETIIYQLEQNMIPALSVTIENCKVLTSKRIVLLPTSCIQNELMKFTRISGEAIINY